MPKSKAAFRIVPLRDYEGDRLYHVQRRGWLFWRTVTYRYKFEDACNEMLNEARAATRYYDAEGNRI